MRTVVEIQEPPFLDAEASRILDFHSTLNALHAVLQSVELVAQTDTLLGEKFSPVLDKLRAIQNASEEFENPVAFLREILSVTEEVAAAIMQVDSLQGLPSAGKKDIDDLRDILAVLKVKTGDLFDREWLGRGWRKVPILSITSRIRNLFQAMEKFSRGRYGITFDKKHHSGRKYLINLSVQSIHTPDLFIPPEIADILGDLVANARKYTKPGGTIWVDFKQDAEFIRCSICDTGIGIPREDILRVVQFGQRGSNIGSIRSMSGGFGLTKAVTYVKGWNGKFWIETEVGKGTEVRFEIPVPKTSAPDHPVDDPDTLVSI
jgi:signal transduction histidine kinase